MKFSIAGTIFDFYDDPYMSVIRGACEEVFEKIGELEILAHDQVSNLSDGGFALVIVDELGNTSRKWPLYDEDTVKLSMHYFDKVAGDIPEAAARVGAFHIERACRELGVVSSETVAKLAMSIPPVLRHMMVNVMDVRQLEELVTPAEKKASKAKTRPVEYKDEDFALTVQGPHRVENFFLVKTSEHVEKSAVSFVDAIQKFNPDQRHEIAARIFKRASELDVNVGEAIRKYAGANDSNIDLQIGATEERLASFSKVSSVGFRARRRHMKSPFKEILDELWEKRGDFTPRSIARILVTLDKRAGIESLWDSYLPDPYATCFADATAAIVKTSSARQVTQDELVKWAGSPGAKNIFNGELEEFRKDPVGAFEVLHPAMQELVVDHIESTR